MQDPAAAASHLSDALATTASWPRRGEIALALAEALALGGQFAAAVDLLTSASAEAADEQSRERLQAALFNTARMDLGTRGPPGRCWSGCRRGRTRRATRTAAGRQPGNRAGGSRAGPRRGGGERPGSAHGDTTADVGQCRRSPGDHLGAAVRRRRCRSQGRGARVAAARATAGIAAVRRRCGRIRVAGRAVWRRGQQGGRGRAARHGRDGQHLDLDHRVLFCRPRPHRPGRAGPRQRPCWPSTGSPAICAPSWPHNLVRHARGCLHAAAGDHAAAVADLLTAGEHADRGAFRILRSCPGARTLPFTRGGGDRAAAIRLATAEVDWRAGGAQAGRSDRAAGGRARRGSGDTSCWLRRSPCCALHPRRWSWRARSSISARRSAGPVARHGPGSPA